MNNVGKFARVEAIAARDTVAQPSDAAAAKGGLIGAALGAFGASACCLGPLLLVSVGVSGAWISYVTVLEPYRWLFIAAALGFIGYAWVRIYRPRPAAACEPGTACALPHTSRRFAALFWAVAALVLTAIVYPYFLPLFY